MKVRLSYLVLRPQHRKTCNVFIATSTTYIIEDENGKQHMNNHSPALRKGMVTLSCAPSCHNPQRTQVQVEQLEAIAAQYLGAPPPPSPAHHQIYNAEPSPPPRRKQPYNDDDMIGGMAPPPSKFPGIRERLQGWLLQVTAYFNITGTRNERQRLAFVGQCMEGKALDWCKANKDKYSSWADVQIGIELYYRDHSRADRAHL